MTATLTWRAEAACRAAWPAPEEIEGGGWRLRFAAGHSQRANSANPMRADPAGPGDILPWIEAEYAARGLPPIIRMPDLVDPHHRAAFEVALVRRRYAAAGDSLTLYAELPQMPVRLDPDVRITPAPDGDWLATQAAWRGWDQVTCDRYRAIVTRVAAPAGFMALALPGGTAAMALVALHGGISCINSMASDPRARRQGHGRRLLGAALAWAMRQGAHAACLQVEADNAAALALYRAMGFTRQLYAYRYWVK